jgi:hypothetical protein
MPVFALAIGKAKPSEMPVDHRIGNVRQGLLREVVSDFSLSPHHAR